MLLSLLYPPTEEQLKIINLAINYFDGKYLFVVLRILSLILLILGVFFWFKLVKKAVGKIIAYISCLLIILSPTFYVLWLSYPTDCIKIFIIFWLLYVLNKKEKALFKLTGILGITLILLFTLFATKERSSFVHKLGLKDAKVEVEERFASEDRIIDPIKIPLSLKRVVYNKYFISYKEVVNEIIPFFDLESIFFQEVHPMEQKSIVIFVWPQLILLITGTYFLFKKNNNRLKLILIITILFSFINYLITPFSVFRKFEFILFPFSLVMAIAVANIFKTKIIFGKVCGTLLVLLSIYGIIANHIDLNKRPDYWLDNRPYYFDFIYKSIRAKMPENFEYIYVDSLVGNSEEYCKFYLKNCNNKYVFNSFDLSTDNVKNKSIYAGFIGEYVGSDFKNNINKDWKTRIESMGFTNLNIKEIRDTIAYKYGNIVVVGEVR
jgi:hypothetical protein